MAAINGNGRPKGYTITWKGYRRITAGPYRHWYEHRKVMYEAAKVFCYYEVNGDLPPGFTVDHVNHDRQDNRLENLLLLDARIHNFLSSWSAESRVREAESAAYVGDGDPGDAWEPPETGIEPIQTWDDCPF